MIVGGGYGFGRSLGAHGYGFAYGVVVPPVEEEHHGKGDNDGRKRHKSIIKPTGLLARKNVKIDQLEKEQHQVVEKVLKGLSKAPEVREEIEVIQMSLAEIDFELKVLLHKQFRTQEDEAMLLILIAANI